jgi:hypothetical protein
VAIREGVLRHGSVEPIRYIECLITNNG